MISFYMKGDALSWFKWMHFNHQLQDWESFTRSLELRFGPSSYENHQQMLFKLRQKGSVIDYQVEFERISNRVYGLSPDSILHCFISGLLPEIQEELALHRPLSTITFVVHVNAWWLRLINHVKTLPSISVTGFCCVFRRIASYPWVVPHRKSFVDVFKGPSRWCVASVLSRTSSICLHPRRSIRSFMFLFSGSFTATPLEPSPPSMVIPLKLPSNSLSLLPQLMQLIMLPSLTVHFKAPLPRI
uniref:Retrotransposon gag domain-containing protein n=1 Tax=Cajanus cajan TaxID=3821 RepID=A0A151T639_CAJCA|nr:hypothetical protein KK1_017036 [Cajanus cajan]